MSDDIVPWVAPTISNPFPGVSLPVPSHTTVGTILDPIKDNGAGPGSGESLPIPGSGVSGKGNDKIGAGVTGDPGSPPPAPSPDQTSVSNTMNTAASQQRRLAAGRASTYLTGGRGLINDPNTARRTLLGS